MSKFQNFVSSFQLDFELCSLNYAGLPIILDYYVVDVDQLQKDDYDELVYHEEWLLLDISTDSGIIEAINSYSVSPVTLAVKIGEKNAET